MIAFVSSREDAQEMNFIYQISQISLRARKLGRIAYERMKKGDFSNTPNIKKKVKKESIKGYD